MTAEIAIMNKSAIALAADSAVTIQSNGGKKIYNTVNKLFALSKYQPFGVMIYGNAEIMGIPWETIIKTYRRKINNKKFHSLKEYADDFLHFLNNNNDLFSDTLQEMYF